MIYRERRLRHEDKYIISAGIYELLRQRLKAVMPLDKNSVDGGYRITSVYFDDVYRGAYNDKILGASQRKKYRIRVYNLSDERISLECKYRDDCYISKRSALLTREQYDSMLRKDYSFGEATEFAGTAMEDFIASAAITGLRPQIIVDYFREAYVNAAGNVRVTFDKSLSTSYNSVDMLGENTNYSPVIDGIILEIKYDEFIPSHIEAIFSGLPLLKESVSKYILCCDRAYEYNHCHFSQKPAEKAGT